MGNILHQKIIKDKTSPSWLEEFEPREYRYLRNIINGMLEHSVQKDVWFQYNIESGKRIFHIFEPFICLNAIGFNAPSVVSLIFTEKNKVHFHVGNDNGYEIKNENLSYKSTVILPRNTHRKIDFWHFVDCIGDRG